MESKCRQTNVVVLFVLQTCFYFFNLTALTALFLKPAHMHMHEGWKQKKVSAHPTVLRNHIASAQKGTACMLNNNVHTGIFLFLFLQSHLIHQISLITIRCISCPPPPHLIIIIVIINRR